MLLFFVSCKETTNNKGAGVPTTNKFVKVDINISTLNFNSTVTFNPDEFGLISWIENNNPDSSYQIYLHCTKNDKNEKMINAMLFKVEKDKSLKLIADNLIDLYGESRRLTTKFQENLEITTSNLSDVEKIEIKKDTCCTTRCSNGRTMTCCNACCEDPAQGCPRCCAN